MRISTLSALHSDEQELGVVYASVEGADASAFAQCLAELEAEATKLGAAGLIGMQLAQSQNPSNPRTSLLATAIKGFD